MAEKTVILGDGQQQCMGCMSFFDSHVDVCPHCGYQVGQPADSLLHMQPGMKLAGRYIVGRTLGYGGFGVTYIGWDTQLKRRIAIKEYMPSQFATRYEYQQELVIANDSKKREQYTKGLKKFRDEGLKLAQVTGIDSIVNMYECFEENNTAYITMEYLEGETLADYLDRRDGMLSEQETMDLMMPILEALREVHSRGLFHRDIAPDNIFLLEDEEGKLLYDEHNVPKVKLIDFGSAKFDTATHSKSLTVLIKPGYSPEEQYQSRTKQGTFTDVYSAAAVMYRMVTGVKPPDAMERRTSMEQERKDLLKLPGDYNKEISANFETALLNALNVRADTRTQTVETFISELCSHETVERLPDGIRRIDFMHWPLWAKITVPLASVAAIALLIFAGTYVFHKGIEDFELPEGMTRVPNFMTASSYEQAEEWAEDAAVTISNTGGEYMPNTAEGLVLYQDPVAGTIIYEKELVAVKVSIGQETFLMPDVTGMPIAAAKAAIECMDVTVEVKEGSAPGLASESVISQSINPYEEIHSGDTVILQVTGQVSSKGGKVPNFVGKTYEEALAAADSSGILLAVTGKTFSADVDVPTVTKQNVAADEELEEGKTVEVTVALPMREFTMPNLVYKDQEKAKQLLKNIGIDAKITEEMSEAVDAGYVFGQNIDAEANVSPGTEVTLSVSKGGKPVPVPNVTGMTLEEARAALGEQGLAAKVEFGYDEKVAEGSVISQGIKAGDEASKGSAVTIVVCSTEGLVKVPSVVGMASGDAQTTLKAQKLGVGVNNEEVYSSTVAKGNVVSQLPAAGSMQKEGTTVVITLSKGPQPTPAPSNNNGGQTSANTPKPAATPTPTPKATPTPKPATTPGPWSSWSTNKPSGDYDIEKKTQYRYRDKETTSSTSSSMSGWTQVDSSTCYGDWGSWSGWSTTAVSSSNTREVQTQYVDPTYRTEYNYSRYNEYNYATAGRRGWNGPTQGNWGGHYCQYYEERGWSTDSLAYAWSDSGYNVYGTSGNYWYNEQTRQVQVSAGYTQYRYRDRTQTTTYYYERWGSWSSWSDNSYTSSSTRQVETQTVYRYRTKGSN